MIAVCLKWVSLQPVVGASLDARFAGMSAADEAALEWALQLAQPDEPVHAVTLGPPDAATVVRRAIASGVTHATHLVAHRPLPSRGVANAIAAAISDARLVFCGDYSLDGGSGSVPAFLAAELGVAQALGLVSLHVDDDAVASKTGRLTAIRRLDGGRRERLRVNGRAVLSVEGSSATLRRAGARATLASAHAVIASLPAPSADPDTTGQAAIADVMRPFRPRPRALSAPQGATLDRLRALTAATSAPAGARNQPIVMDPLGAARAILDSLPPVG